MRGRGIALVTLVANLLALPLFAGELGTEAQQQAGKKNYDKFCSQCHGDNGDGRGYATAHVKPAPRDFTEGKYKFRTTPSGMLPTDDDLRRVIRDGLAYTSMPGWPNFSDQEVQEIIYYLKTFSADFQNPDKQADPIEIPAPPPVTAESIERGRVVYEGQGCAACHGELGRGDGLSAPTMTNDWGAHIRPANMSQRWTFRGGPTRTDMFRTFSTGLNGTPMPSYADSLEVEDRWDLINYMESLGDGDDPNYANLLLVPYLDDEIDLARGEELFERAPMARFPLVGQIVEPGRNFYPSASSIEVRAVYNRKEMAIQLQWYDMRAESAGSNAPDAVVPPWDEQQRPWAGSLEKDPVDEDDPWGGAEVEDDPWGEEVEEEGGDFWGEEEDDPAAVGGEFSDAVAVQLPSVLPGGIRKPYVLFGDLENSVDLWFVDLAQGDVAQYQGRGSANITPNDSDEFETTSGYDRGLWTVTFKRALKGSGISFQQDQYVPIAFSVWDGFNRERGNKRALTSWVYLYVEPSEKVSVVGPMLRAALITLGIELLLVFWIRRRYGKRKQTDELDGVLAGQMAR